MNEILTPGQALELMRENPCDITPGIVALRATADLDDPALPLLCARIAVALPSQRDVDDLMGDRASLMANFYPTPKENTPSTEDTIDTFLSTFGAADARETDALTRVIFNPTPDYAATLATEERESMPEAPTGEESEQDRLINSFILGTHAPAPTPTSREDALADPATSKAHSEKSTNEVPQPAAEQKTGEQSTLTESFVRMLIKNGNYAKALEIISEINLNNPKKSIYFADQIRFLKKLIINANNK